MVVAVVVTIDVESFFIGFINDGIRANTFSCSLVDIFALSLSVTRVDDDDDDADVTTLVDKAELLLAIAWLALPNDTFFFSVVKVETPEDWVVGGAATTSRVLPLVVSFLLIVFSSPGSPVLLLLLLPMAEEETVVPADFSISRCPFH